MRASRGRAVAQRLTLSTAMLLALAAPALADADNGPMTTEEQAARVRSAQFVAWNKYVTPEAAPRSRFEILDAGLPANIPHNKVGQAISTAVSPDKRTLLVLTSGYNDWNFKN